MNQPNQRALERKIRSIEVLKEYNVPYIENLPVIETSDCIKIRTKDEIAKRAITCLITIQLACDVMNDHEAIDECVSFCKGLLEQFEVEECLTEKEKAIFSLEADQQSVINMVWKYEAYWILLWALGIVEELDYPSHICDCNFAIEAVSSCENYEDFISQAKLRDIEEILDQADLIFRYDWACVDARIKGMEAPAGLDSGVVFERHWGINWLIDADEEDDWDYVGTNT